MVLVLVVSGGQDGVGGSVPVQCKPVLELGRTKRQLSQCLWRPELGQLDSPSAVRPISQNELSAKGQLLCGAGHGDQKTARSERFTIDLSHSPFFLCSV